MKHYWKRNKLLLAITLIIGIFSAVLSAFISIVLQKVIDAAISNDIDAFTNTLIFTLIYSIVLCLLSYFSALAGKYLLLKISKQMREDVFNGIMRHTPAQFAKNNTADYISALTNDIKMIEENYILVFFMTVELVVMFIATLVILLFLSPLITIILFANMLLMFLIPALFGKLLEKRQDSISKALSSYTEKIKDIFSGFEVIKNYRMLPHVRKQFQNTNNNTTNARFAADRMFALNEGLSETLSILSIVIVIFVSAWLVMKGSITMGTLLALTQLSGTFMTPIIMIMQNIPKLKSMAPIIEKLTNTANYKETEWQGTAQPTFAKEISLKNVSFGYNNQKEILKNISISFEKGKKYAILGNSGSGKTTLIKLLAGYYSSYKGSIFYDDLELKTIANDKLSDVLCIMHQNVYLFNNTVKENITLFEQFTAEELSDAMVKSGVSKFIDKLENGINTPAGENGSNLSGGQKQRIALARAFIRNITFMILDEGTSAVDGKTAYDIESGLLANSQLTLITITHSLNPELLKKYDKIIYLADGSVQAEGRFDEIKEYIM